MKPKSSMKGRLWCLMLAVLMLFSGALPSSAGDVDPREHMCLSVMTFLEARGESTKGRVGAMLVTQQRMEEGFLDATSICEVFYGSGQYEPVLKDADANDPLQKTLKKVERMAAKHVLEQEAWDEIQDLAKRFLEGDEALIAPAERLVADANYFITKKRCKASKAEHWCRKFRRRATIGNHIFLRGTVL